MSKVLIVLLLLIVVVAILVVYNHYDVQRAGDGVMIILNDPIQIDEPAAKAVGLAVSLRDEIRLLCNQWRSYDYDLGFGIGLSYGYATLGLVGSQNHQNYTAIGPSVNIASRLCDHASDGEVLATQRVRTEAPEFEFESIWSQLCPSH